MTQKVTIKGGQQNGAQLTNAASEATLVQILTSLQQLNSNLSKQNSSSNSGSSSNDSGFPDDVVDDINNLGDSSWTAAKALGALSYGIGFVVGATVTVGTAFNGLVKDFREMSNAGTILGDSIASVSESASDARIPLEIFMASVKKNNLTMAGFGGTVTKGALLFNSMTKKLQESGFYNNLAMLGYSMSEISDVMGTYIGIQTRAGKSQTMSVEQLTNSTARFAGQIDRFAKLGFSRDQMLAGVDKESRDERLRALTSNWSGGNRDNLLTTMSAIGQVDERLAESIRSMISSFGLPTAGDTGTTSLALIPGFSSLISKISSGREDPMQILSFLKKYASSNQTMNSQMNAHLISTGKMTPDYFLQSIQGLKGMDIDQLKFSNEQKKAVDSANTSVLKFDIILQQITSSFKNLFFNTGILDVIGTFATELAGEFKMLSDSIVDVAKPMVSEMSVMARKFASEIAQAFRIFNAYLTKPSDESFLSKFGTAFNEAFMKPLSAIYESTIKPQISDWFSGIFSSSEYTKIKEDVSESISTGISDGTNSVISDLKKELPSVMSLAAMAITAALAPVVLGAAVAPLAAGAAGILAAWANPTTLLGAGVLAGSVTLLMGAISASAWMLGTALPTLADGFKKFESLDGNALSKVSSGLIDMSKAILALSVIAVPTAFANMISGFFSAFTFGDTPLEQMEKFSNTSININGIETNAKAIQAYVESFTGLSEVSSNLERTLDAGKIDSFIEKLGNLSSIIKKMPMSGKLNGIDSIKIPTIEDSGFSSSADRVINKMSMVIEKYGELSNVMAADKMKLAVDNAVTINNSSIGSEIKNVQEKTNGILTEMSSAIRDMRNKIMDEKPTDTAPIIDNGKEQLKQLSSIQTGINSLCTAMSEMLLVMQSVNHVNRQSLNQLKNNAEFM